MADKPKDERSFFEKALETVDSAISAVGQMRRKKPKKKAPLASKDKDHEDYVGTGGAARSRSIMAEVDRQSGHK